MTTKNEATRAADRGIAEAVAQFLAARADARGVGAMPHSVTAMFCEDASGAPSVHVMAWSAGEIVAQAIASL